MDPSIAEKTLGMFIKKLREEKEKQSPMPKLRGFAKLAEHLTTEGSHQTELSFHDLEPTTNVQAITHTVVVDVSQDEDALWHSFRQRARRAIRGGRREQLRVIDRPITPETIRIMFQLYKETADRNNLSIRAKTYFEQFWTSFADSDGTFAGGQFFFVFGPRDDQPVAGAFVCWSGKRALYKDGGSLRVNESKHFSHLLQWEIMQFLRDLGITSYDLDGTPPSHHATDSSEPLATLAPFKLSFGALITDYIGTFDQVLKPREYRRWQRFVERIWRKTLQFTSQREIF
jgi:lipid II:glycine glycyltransferase (peptidoglycan interpeptide bridge formation enzyme)